ncbi:membrane-spanning 4-domains subfamily A member 15-like [Pyxicephalus adspersus]|uniref:membrane-spanning 4-domains subfamily A member 15-like n=1 Tax=Pyxicephalus adspersus TaxID=30357 RepID=UPI003B5CE2BA
MSELHEVLVKGQTKTLGAVQLMIVFIHIALGALLMRLDNSSEYITYTAAYGLNLWGIVFYIISGSLSISLENKENPSSSFVKSFITMNSLSAIEAIGVIAIFSYDIYRAEYFGAYYLTVILVFMIISNVLEFSVTVALCNVGRLAKKAMSTRQPAAQMFTIPTQYGNPMTSQPDNSQRFGGPNPYLQPQSYPAPSAQPGLKSTPNFTQQECTCGYNNRGFNMQYN